MTGPTNWKMPRTRGSTLGEGAKESGATLVEYALLLALVAVVAVVALSFLGGSTAGTINGVARTAASNGQSWGPMTADCGGVTSCQLKVTNPDTNATYLWTLPNGKTVTQDCATAGIGSGPCGVLNIGALTPGGQVTVQGYSPETGLTTSAAMVCNQSPDPSSSAGWSWSCV